MKTVKDVLDLASVSIRTLVNLITIELNKEEKIIIIDFLNKFLRM